MVIGSAGFGSESANVGVLIRMLMNDELTLPGGLDMHSADLSLESIGCGSFRQSELGLVTAMRAGSEMAFAELHRLYAHSLYRTILSITRNREDAEDVLQETLMRAYLGLDSFEGRSKLHSWLTRIAINSSLMVLRKRRTRREASFESLPFADDGTPQFQVKDSGPNPEEFCLQRERGLRVAKAMAGLKPPMRNAMQTQLNTGGSMEEIAQSLDISVAAVKARLHRARRYVTERTRRDTQLFSSRKGKSAKVRLG